MDRSTAFGTAALTLLLVVICGFGCDEPPREIQVKVSPPPSKLYRVVHLTRSGVVDTQQSPVSRNDLLKSDAIEIRLPADLKPLELLEMVPIECVGTRADAFSLRLVVPGQSTIELEIATEFEARSAVAAETGRQLPTRNVALVDFDEFQVMTVKHALNDPSGPYEKHRTASLGVDKRLSFKILVEAIERLKSSGFDRFCFRKAP